MDMDMEMSGVAAWSFFFVSTPPRSTASGLHSFYFSFPFFYQTFYFYFWPCSYSGDTKYMNNGQQYQLLYVCSGKLNTPQSSLLPECH